MATARTTTTLEVDGSPATVHLLGDEGAPPLLLLHGGWAGAEAHWSTVWERLARSHRVIAPELPGIMQGGALPSIGDYARFAARLLDALGVERAVVVGNSLGAAIGWSLAVREPRRVRGLVLVDGGPFDGPRDPMIRLLLALPGGRRLLRWMLRYNTYSPSTIGRAFADPRRAPAEVVRTVSQRPEPPQVAPMVALFTRGDDAAASAPTMPSLVVWGRDDRLIGVSVRTGERLAKRLPHGRLVVLDGAGHLPQLEQPEAFVAAVEELVRAA